MKAIIFLSIFLLLSCSSTKLRIKNNIVSGIIAFEKYDIITSVNTHHINKSFREGLDVMGLDSTSKSHKAMTQNMRYDSLKLRLQIQKEYYWEPYFLKDGSKLTKGKFTDRDSLYQCNKNSNEIDLSCDRKINIKYHDEADYTFQFLKNERKLILGYDCFKIIAKKENKHYATSIYEMYVTEDILLNYHPFMKFETFKNKYFIMELLTYSLGDKGIRREYHFTNIELNYN